MEYAARLVLATHPRPAAAEPVRKYVRYGASPRGGLALIWGAKAHAFLAGRHHVDVGDVRAAALPALVHRLVLSFRAEAEGVTPHRIVQAVLGEVRAP